MDALGYRPNWAGRALRRRRTGLVAAIVSTPGNPWQARMVRELQRELWRRGLDLVTVDCGETDADVERVRMFLDRSVVDACLILGLEALPAPSRGLLADASLPVIAVGEGTWDDVAQVRFGYGEAVRSAVRTLADRGVRRFALVLDRTAEPTAIEGIFRVPALHQIRTSTGTSEVPETTVRAGISPDHESLERILTTGTSCDDPLVLLCTSDRLAVQVRDHLMRERHLVVGEEIGIVGRGDIEEARALGVSLSTLGGPGDGASVIARMLAEAADSGDQPTAGIVLPWGFIERRSTSALTGPGSV